MNTPQRQQRFKLFVQCVNLRILLRILICCNYHDTWDEVNQMATRESTLREIKETGVVAVIRMSDPKKLQHVVQAIREGGVSCIEITMTTPKALQMIEKTADAIGDNSVIGVGSVLDPETARAAILAGAEYVVCPTLNRDVIEMSRRYGKVVIPGAMTPTEILTAWQAGADVVKVFPATSLGPQYIKDIKGPLPQIELSPTGGVDANTIGAFIKAGASAVAVGSALLNKQAIADEKYEVLTDLAKQLTEEVRKARA
jgi:2-dehydro-3-deoxyphosphogluconate aldolase / (4S)-4-hydroxy-2-oxoglutarate aldolase